MPIATVWIRLQISIFCKSDSSLAHVCGGSVATVSFPKSTDSTVEGDFRSICDSLAIVEHAGTLRDSAGESPGGLEIGESKEGARKTKNRTGVSQVACTENLFVSVRRSGSQKRDETRDWRTLIRLLCVFSSLSVVMKKLFFSFFVLAKKSLSSLDFALLLTDSSPSI